MSTKSRIAGSIIPAIVITVIAYLGLQMLLSGSGSGFGLAVIALDLGLIALALVARRKGSTTFERIITLMPRDERDQQKIQWGFAQVGKVTLVLFTLIGLTAFGFYLNPGSRLTECIGNGTAVNTICHPTEVGFMLYGVGVVTAIFAVTFLVAAVVASLRRD
jgi:magnesium-transporting ATPase (P-type)